MFKQFSWQRFVAIFNKEFTQMRRDRLTFAMLIGIPIMQLILFGFAINTNPKYLPTAVVNADITPMTRSFVSAIQNTEYFNIVHDNISDQEAQYLLAKGDVNFVVHFPNNFSRDLIRGEHPSLLVSVDATDPIASGSAINALTNLSRSVFDFDISHGLSYLQQTPSPFNLIIHPKYNPEAITQYNIVPALMGVVLTMTLVLITSLAITRERERGTMEGLLATPVLPSEVLLGKVIPYILVGYIQMVIIVLCGRLIFQVPFEGSFITLLLATLPFILANLTVGITISTIVSNQLQAMQMTFFFFLPSILLSGFMFPVKGMPIAIQWISGILPLTHYLVITRGIVLKGNTFIYFWPEILKILIFSLAVIFLGLKRFRKTLD